MAKLKIDLPEEKVKTVFKIKKSSHEILNSYTLYLSDLHNKKVSQDAIVDSLLENLAKDKDFKKFSSKNKDLQEPTKKEQPKQVKRNDSSASMAN